MLHGCRKHKSTRFFFMGKQKKQTETEKNEKLKRNNRDKCPFENKKKKRTNLLPAFIKLAGNCE